jgi:hypothetical protein
MKGYRYLGKVDLRWRLIFKVKTSKSKIDMAFEDSGCYPQWPKVADAVIEAGCGIRGNA